MTDAIDELSALRIERDPLPPPGRRWVKWLVGLLVLGAVAVGVRSWLTRVQPTPVDVAVVTTRAAGTQAAVLNASGYVTARRRATVSSKVTGRITEVNVEEGKTVRAGDILARLDDAAVRASLSLLEAQTEAARRAVTESEVRLAEAERTLVRRERLRTDGLITDADLDQARADVESLKARIAASREQVTVAERQVALRRTELEDMVIRAPFTGVAISKDAQPGEMVSPVSAGGGFTRTGICTIVDMTSLEIEVDVNESYINRVTPGQAVAATLDAYPDWRIPASVITTIPAADRQKATVLVRIAFAELDERVLPDMGVKVTFLREPTDTEAAAERPVALVPRSAVRSENGTSYALVLKQDTVERRAIRLGGTDGDRVEVAAGLSAGERVVVAPPPGLLEGQPVVVKQGQ